MSKVTSWRDTRTTAERGYGYRWQKARETFLARNPLCVMCLETGQATPATVVDHKVAHKGDQKLFWDKNNWQPLCKLHHDSTKKRYENSGRYVGCDQDGLPLDKSHHWFK